MCTDFLRLAKGDYKMACFAENNLDVENWDGMCCYHLQQAVEKVLKYCIGHLGGKYLRTHSISSLYNQYLSLGGVPINNLQLYGNILSSWEATSRYEGSSLTVTQDEINIVKKIYADLCNAAFQSSTFDATEFLKMYYGHKFEFLPKAAVADCHTEEDCLALIEQLKNFFA